MTIKIDRVESRDSNHEKTLVTQHGTTGTLMKDIQLKLEIF